MNAMQFRISSHTPYKYMWANQMPYFFLSIARNLSSGQFSLCFKSHHWIISIADLLYLVTAIINSINSHTSLYLGLLVSQAQRNAYKPHAFYWRFVYMHFIQHAGHEKPRTTNVEKMRKRVPPTMQYTNVYLQWLYFGHSIFSSTGDRLTTNVISSHDVASSIDCGQQCLQQVTCAAFNYRSNQKKSNETNCQLTNNTEGFEENGAINNVGIWIFYKALDAVISNQTCTIRKTTCKLKFYIWLIFSHPAQRTHAKTAEYASQMFVNRKVSVVNAVLNTWGNSAKSKVRFSLQIVFPVCIGL